MRILFCLGHYLAEIAFLFAERFEQMLGDAEPLSEDGGVMPGGRMLGVALQGFLVAIDGVILNAMREVAPGDADRSGKVSEGDPGCGERIRVGRIDLKYFIRGDELAIACLGFLV